MSFSAQNLVVRRGGNTILNEVSLSVPAAKLTIVLGQNGAGKSTLLHTLAGGIIPDSGSVFCDETPIRRLHSRELARRRAVLMQSTHSVFDFTVLETVLLGRTPWIGFAETLPAREIALNALHTVGLDGFADRRLSTLSGGERQRVQIARTFAQGITPPGTPTTFFLDEPLAALDFRHRLEIMHCLSQLAQAGNAVFVVLHDLNLSLRFADHLIVMQQGRIALEGSPKFVLTPKNLAEVFGIQAEIVATPSGEFVHILDKTGNQQTF